MLPSIDSDSIGSSGDSRERASLVTALDEESSDEVGVERASFPAIGDEH